jgi:hypothetical protein
MRYDFATNKKYASGRQRYDRLSFRTEFANTSPAGGEVIHSIAQNEFLSIRFLLKNDIIVI